MRFNSKINFPQKSLFGFKVLSSLHSSIACYILLVIGKFLNNFFGFSQIQIIAGSLFNIFLNVSIVILILNLLIKRKQIQKIYFILLNSLLLIYLPFSLYYIGKYIKILVFTAQISHKYLQAIWDIIKIVNSLKWTFDSKFIF